MRKGQQSKKRDEGVPLKLKNVQVQAPTIYVNNAAFGMTEWDMTVDISEIHSADMEEMALNIIPRARLVMSPPFAIRFYQAMGAQIAKHQELTAKRIKEFEKSQQSHKSEHSENAS